MINTNTIYIFFFIFAFIIVLGTNILNIKHYDVEKILLECSFFFDKISDDKDVKSSCYLEDKDFKKFRRNIDRFLIYLNNMGFIKSKFFIINNKDCFFYDTNKQFEICKDYAKNKNKDCVFCQLFWNSMRKNPGKLLKNNLLKIEEEKEIIIYKSYKCKKDELFLIGTICQDKY